MGVSNKDRDVKQPYEARTYEVFFGGARGKLDDDDFLILDDCAVQVFDSDGTEVTDDMLEDGSIAVSGQSMFARIIGGEDGKEYRVEFRSVSNKGEKVEHDFKVVVKD